MGEWVAIAASVSVLVERTGRNIVNTHSTTQVINLDRRRLLSTAATGLAIAGAASLLPWQLTAAHASDAVRPFRINVPEEELVDLRRRINAARWPDQETVDDGSQGPQLAKFQEAMRHWGTDYDWRKVEARLNALPMFLTEIDGVDIHFIHIRSRHENALPLIVTHGWPGSIIEQIKIIDPLTNPTAHGGSASDAFHLVIPSIPGFGFSGRPKQKGWGPDLIARAWAELMRRLGHTRYVAQGGDWGSPVSSAMARQAAPGLLGIHINLPATVPSDVAMALAGGGPAPAGLSDQERAAFDSLDTFFKKYMAYGAIMGTRPQAIGYGLSDSPVGLAAWIFDYNNGEPARRLHRDDVLDNITLYWLTNTATSAARIYWETAGQSVILAAAQKTSEISLPVAITVFPSTKSTKAATSPPGSSRSSSRKRSAPRSGRCEYPDPIPLTHSKWSLS
jgi:pimeloyl-ACP methyl ester carboxylesterase